MTRTRTSTALMNALDPTVFLPESARPHARATAVAHRVALVTLGVREASEADAVHRGRRAGQRSVLAPQAALQGWPRHARGAGRVLSDRALRLRGDGDGRGAQHALHRHEPGAARHR